MQRVRSNISAAIIFWLAPASPLLGQASFDVFVAATNHIVEVATDAGAPPGDLVRAMREGCLALEALLEEPAIQRDLGNWRVADPSQTRLAERQRLAESLTLYRQIFLTAERELLVRLGFTDQAVLFALAGAEEHQDAIGQETMPDAYAELSGLRDQTCGSYLEYYESDVDPDGRGRFVQRAMGFAGAALTLADVVGLPATAGLSAGSILVGAAMIVASRDPI